MTSRFALDCYRRFITMYSNVVLGVSHHSFEDILDDHKDRLGVSVDTDIDRRGLVERIIADYKAMVKSRVGHTTSRWTPRNRCGAAVKAVFGSWMNDRAKFYRKMHDIPEDWGHGRQHPVDGFSAIWAILRPRASLSPATRRTGIRASMASSCSTPRAKTWSLASVRRRP